ncbi:Type-1 restriction enzyme EcoKI specificity protein [Streptomyces sp. ADI97-07]|uniref:restriction endonuclease subunit S n=1 Tax=Streptomyces sp. ADI97-07 TaxID=1522762 RepID=UPI000FB020B2|nr:restriction endonuclease subunit S [Streptomyces sp. ADI97-07]RPK78764.1 Type-1 restriction enzyme EcoKI specificity protein [Streptomyces sp. ADI97-07]
MELPAGWARPRLDEIAEVRLGRQRSPKNHTGDQMRPYIRAANVGWDGLRLLDVKQMNFTDEELDTYRLRPGDIVLGEASGSPGEVGKPALWNGEIEDCCFQNTLIRVRAPRINSKFLLHFLRYEALRGGFAEGARGVGIHHLGAAKLSAWDVALPPLAEQERIVEVLEAHLSHLDVAARSLDHAESLTPLQVRSLNTAAATGLLFNSGNSDFFDFHMVRQELWRSRNGTKKYKEPAEPDRSSSLEVPENWAVHSLEAVTDPIRIIRYGILMPKVEAGGVVPYVEVKDLLGCTLHKKTLHLTSVELDEQFAGARIRHGDVVLAVRGSYDRSAVVPESVEKANLSRDVARLAPLPGLLPEFLQIFLQSGFAQRYLKKHARGVAVKGVNISALRSMPIAVPPLTVQKEIVSLVEARGESLAKAEESVRMARLRAKALRKSLLRCAFTGALVAQEPADEPASSLIARIQAERAEQPKAKRTRRASASLKAVATTTPLPAPRPTIAPTASAQQELPL